MVVAMIVIFAMTLGVRQTHFQSVDSYRQEQERLAEDVTDNTGEPGDADDTQASKAPADQTPSPGKADDDNTASGKKTDKMSSENELASIYASPDAEGSSGKQGSTQTISKKGGKSKLSSLKPSGDGTSSSKSKHSGSHKPGKSTAAKKPSQGKDRDDKNSGSPAAADADSSGNGGSNAAAGDTAGSGALTQAITGAPGVMRVLREQETQAVLEILQEHRRRAVAARMVALQPRSRMKIRLPVPLKSAVTVWQRIRSRHRRVSGNIFQPMEN